MKLSEKIILLRQQSGMTQEELAERCNVSRQSISKWESGSNMPDIQRLIQLGDIFHVPADVLLRETLDVSGTREMHTCSVNALQEREAMLYEGILIKESLDSDEIIDLLRIHKVELWRTGGKPRYWTALYFSSDVPDLPERFSRVMLDKPERWFVDFKDRNMKYIVFRNQVLHYHLGSAEEKERVCRRCRELGIADEQMNWSE